MLGKLENDNKEVKQIIIGCECGCEQAINIVRYIDDNDYYITFTGGLFYERQRGIFKTIGKRLKAAWYMLRGKEYLMCDVNIDKIDIDKIIKALEDIKNGR